MIQQPQQTPAVPPVDLSQLPTEPGVYLFKDTAGEVLYVGKAIKLRHRVRQYWQREAQGDGRFHIGFLVPRIAEVEVVVTRSEREALILEDNLIKKYQPRYNVRLKDDKSWLSLRLDVRARFPRVTTVRRWRDDGSRYFGPTSTTSRPATSTSCCGGPCPCAPARTPCSATTPRGPASSTSWGAAAGPAPGW